MLIKKLNDKTIGIVVIPDGASNICLPKIGIADLYFHKEGELLEEDSYISVAIPQGNWCLLSLSKEMTEDKACEILGATVNGGGNCPCLYNFKMLLKGHGLNGDNYAILIKDESVK